MKKNFATLPGIDCVKECKDKIDRFYRYIISSKFNLLLWKCFNYYFTANVSAGYIMRTGNHSEFSKIMVSDFRNLLQHQLLLVTNNRPAWDCRSVNNDFTSKTQTIIGNALLDYYLKEDGIEDLLVSAVEKSLYSGEGFVEVAWNIDKGRELTDDQGNSVRTGNIDLHSYSTLEVIRDVLVKDWKKNNWVILRKEVNRYDLANAFPDYYEQIINLPSVYESLQSYDIPPYKNRGQLNILESDQVILWTLYHKKCPACPDGRLVEFVDDDSFVLTDVPLPYEEIPVHRVASANWDGSCFGYSVAFDLVPIQEAENTMFSTALTNNKTFGVQVISVEAGTNYSASEFGEGLSVIERPQGSPPPQGINLTATAPELYNFLSQLQQKQETLSGVNSVVRGDPTGALRGNSGSALALVQSQSVQFMNGLVASYNQLLEDVGNSMIKRLQKFAQLPILADIVGKNNRALLQEFTGEDISMINRVQVQSANPITKTLAGKINLADTLLQSGIIKTSDDYLMVLQTGNLQPMIHGETSELLLIADENEKISAGEIPQAIYSDNHVLHIKEHNAVGSSTEARENPDVIQALLSHCQQHIDLLRNTDPQLLQILGQQPLQAPNPQPEGGQGGMDLPAQPVESPLQQAQPRLPNQPSLPKLPGNASDEAQASYSESLEQIEMPNDAK